MAKRHDENKDLKSFSRIGKIGYGDKTLKCSKATIIGIHMWGKIDFLTHHCGWTLIYDNRIIVNTKVDDEDNSRHIKKIKKEHKLTDKSKKK